MKIPKIAVLATAVAGSLFLMTGCSSTSASPAGSVKGDVKINFAADWISPDITWLPYVVALSRGTYKKAGLDVNLIQPPDSSSDIKFLASGQADLAQTTITDVMLAAQEGLPVISVANESQTNNWGLFAKDGGPITVADLKGQTVGVYNDSMTKTMLPLILKTAGLTVSDVKQVLIPDSALPLVLNGKIKYATNTSNFTGAQLKATLGHTTPSLLAKDVGAPDMPIWLYAGNKSWLKNNPAAAKKFLSATEVATKWASANPDAAVSAYEKYFKMGSAGHKVNLAEWNATIPLLDAGNGYFTATDKQYSSFADALVAAGQLKAAKSPSAYFTNKYIQN
jgi:putative hydroxymethylpyrimidine transport system substrate-binding protein